MNSTLQNRVNGFLKNSTRRPSGYSLYSRERPVSQRESAAPPKVWFVGKPSTSTDFSMELTSLIDRNHV